MCFNHFIFIFSATNKMIIKIIWQLKKPRITKAVLITNS